MESFRHIMILRAAREACWGACALEIDGMATSRGETQVATASYIESMLGELHGMSTKIDAGFLSYLLEMAVDEAARVANTKPESAINRPHTLSAEDLADLYMNGNLD